MTAYLVAEIEVTDAPTFDAYRPLAAAAIANFGGRYLVRGGAVEPLEDWNPKRIVVIEFHDLQQARDFYYSAEYAPAKKLRRASANSRIVLVEAVSSP